MNTKQTGSTSQTPECEAVAKNLLAIFARNSNVFKPIAWNEYVNERKADGDFSENEKPYFDELIQHCKDAESFALFSLKWRVI